MVVGVGRDTSGGGGRWFEKRGRPETLAVMAGGDVDREGAAGTEGEVPEREDRDACRESRSGRSGAGVDAPLSAILTSTLNNNGERR